MFPYTKKTCCHPAAYPKKVTHLPQANASPLLCVSGHNRPGSFPSAFVCQVIHRCAKQLKVHNHQNAAGSCVPCLVPTNPELTHIRTLSCLFCFPETSKCWTSILDPVSSPSGAGPGSQWEGHTLLLESLAGGSIVDCILSAWLQRQPLDQGINSCI